MHYYAPVARVVGSLLVILALAMMLPLTIDLISGRDDLPAIEFALLMSLVAGMNLVLIGYRPGGFELDRRQTFLCTAGAWIVLPVFAAIPFLGAGLTPVDAFFEAVSGFTTTGSTVLTGLDRLAPGLLLWRSFLQWLGGIGIIVMAVSLLPFMHVAGMQLFQSESSDKSDKVLADPTELVRWICAIYLGLTIGCTLAYEALGMSGFDALNHAMTTVSTGGYSTHDASFGYFEPAGLQWAAALFMMLSSLPFVVYVKAMNLRRNAIISDAQVPVFLAFLASVSLIMALWLARVEEISLGKAMTLTTFNIVSVVTTTGFASTDYTLWGAPAVGAFFLLTFVGGCSGSTAGGLKIYRLQVLVLLVVAHLKGLISPSRVVPLRYNGRNVSPEVTISILAFLILFTATVAFGTLILGMMGLDVLTSLTASATAVANVGPGLGPIIGPSGNFAPLPDGAKLVLAFEMLAGRLEFFTLLVMFSRSFWIR
ncbi:TrkH family potassium uptake protein [Parvularcula dongshanensis]|uniref:Trk system potassium uptake protein n=1 Tax=Parvularcula dongshanensis TaxID=1173995 RepID=A0A840I038_9PROT|nr:TrkH family potassium uptake protein [Parvularcula dongshanensis]MBB4658189.1 trk system potassium uptake protein TrkH [Parvularcula dongshanensis]